MSNLNLSSSDELVSSQFGQVQLPVIHLQNIYINVGDRLERSLANDLILWTHSEQFHHNTTSIPVITAIFNPFSAVNWLAFNSTNLELSGHAPFATISYNVSVTLVPRFVDKAEEIAIPIHFNNTPMTFTTTSFSVCVLGEQPANSGTKEWIPYLIMALMIVSVTSFVFALITCCRWQDMCHRSPGSPRLDKNVEEVDPLDEKENKSMRKKCFKKLEDLEAALPSLTKTSNCDGHSQVTPYDIFKPSSISMRLANLHTVTQERFTLEAQTPVVCKNFHYASIVTGSSFAYKLSWIALYSAEPQLNIRARAEPRSPEWIRFCPETMVIWGTVPEDALQFMPNGLDILILSDSFGYALAKLRITIRDGPPGVSAGRFVSLFGDETRSETVNGVDILYLPPDTRYRIKYCPPLPQGSIREGRYRFHSSSKLPSWLALNPHTLEFSGDTSGHRSVNHVDLLFLDSYTRREAARLRIIAIIGDVHLHVPGI